MNAELVEKYANELLVEEGLAELGWKFAFNMPPTTEKIITLQLKAVTENDEQYVSDKLHDQVKLAHVRESSSKNTDIRYQCRNCGREVVRKTRFENPTACRSCVDKNHVPGTEKKFDPRFEFVEFSVVDENVGVAEKAHNLNDLPIAAYDAETVAGMEWDSIRKELETIYMTALSNDDPIRMMADTFRIVWTKAYRNATRDLQDRLDQIMIGFNRAQNASAKLRREEAQVDIARMVTVGQEMISGSTKEAIEQIESSVEELREAADELRGMNRGMRKFDWLIGATIMAVVLVAGVALGVLWMSLKVKTI